MNVKLPRVSKGFDHLRFGGEVVVLTVFYFSLIHKRLEVGTVFDAVRRVNVDHLDLTAHTFFFQEAVHH